MAGEPFTVPGLNFMSSEEVPDDYGRFWSKVDRKGDCWLWLASKDAHGYGRFRFEGENQMAHRVAYILSFGAIPEGLELDHLCRVRSCVNPSHLDPVTHKVNITRSELALATLASTHVTKTHCPQGHPYSEENTEVKPQGWRQCRTCRREQSLAAYHRKKARV